MGSIPHMLSSLNIKGGGGYLPLHKIDWEPNSHPYRVVIDKIYYLYIYLHINRVISASKIIEFTQND